MKIIANHRGIGLVPVLIAVAIFGIVAFSTLQIGLIYKNSASQEKVTDSSIHVLANKITKVRALDFMDLALYCRDKDILGNTPKLGACLNGESIKTTKPANRLDLELGLEMPLDSIGNFATNEKIQSCIEIVQCRPRSGGHILEITLNQYLSHAIDKRTSSRSRTFRRSKW